MGKIDFLFLGGERESLFCTCDLFFVCVLF